MECEGSEHLLLATKLAIPPTYRKKIVPRPRLYSQLEAGVQRPLTLITAPAGFGKTTLIGEWLRQCHIPVAWVSLEESDNDLARFWRYLLKALSSVYPDLSEHIGTYLKLSQALDIEALLTTLINTLMTLPQDMILALDGYQTISESAIHQSLQFLLEHLPPQLHLFITTRTSFPLPIARLRVQGKLAELRAADLRFTPDETEQFLTQAMGLSLSMADIAALDECIEGWVAGLQLAALSLQGRNDPATITKTINAFSGQQRSVLYYLTDEVFACQPPVVQDFLLATSVLERMNADLCDAITRKNNGQVMLEQLDASNLFLLVVDAQEKWYRYYHLFADFLRYRLRNTYPELEPELHLRACTWYEQHGMIVEAITHALASGAMEHAANLIEEHTWSLIWQQNESMVYSWLVQLPPSIFTTRPTLCYLWAWILYVRADIQASERALEQAEYLWQQEKNNAMLARIHDFRAYVALLCGNGAQTMSHAQQTLALANGHDISLHASALVALGGAYLLMGEIVQARTALSEGYRLSQKSGNIVSMQLATIYLGKVYLVQGNLRAAYQTYQQMLAEIDELQAWYSADTHVQLAKIYREWNNLAAAHKHWKQALHIIEKGRPEGFVSTESSILAAQLAWIRSEPDEVQTWLDRAEQSARRFGINRMAIAAIANLRVHFFLAQGDMNAALSWAKHYQHEAATRTEVSLIFPSSTGFNQPIGAEMPLLSLGNLDIGYCHFKPIRTEVPLIFPNKNTAISSLTQSMEAETPSAAFNNNAAANSAVLTGAEESPYEKESYALMQGRLMIAQERSDTVIALLEEVLQIALEQGRHGSVIAILVLLTLAYHAGGNTYQTLQTLERALSMAESAGYIRTFVDEGPVMAILLTEFCNRYQRRPVNEQEKISLEYIYTILAALGQDIPTSWTTSHHHAHEREELLLDALSERERTVLLLIAEGLSNQEIARALVVTVSTVKTHLNNIYAKLRVHTRLQAVTRAYELGLLSRGDVEANHMKHSSKV
jgi:LuxR family maltose regulon positive regulatory protein